MQTARWRRRVLERDGGAARRQLDGGQHRRLGRQRHVRPDGISGWRGIGADIWGTSDQFEYVYDYCYGDLTITARVRSLQNTNQWAKAGVMFRESIAANAKQVDMIVSPAKGVAMQFRAATGGSTVHAGGAAGAAPGWVRLTREGDSFTAAWSKDGLTWTTIGSATVSMPHSILVGLAVTSHNTSATAAASFDDVVLRQPWTTIGSAAGHVTSATPLKDR